MCLFKKKATYFLDVKGCLLVIYTLLNRRPVYRMLCTIMSDNSIHIGDIAPPNGIQGRYENKGYGSEMMKMLIEYAVAKNICEITGKLSCVDEGHKDRLHHFYEKFGFEITIYPEVKGNYYGEIRKRL